MYIQGSSPFLTRPAVCALALLSASTLTSGEVLADDDEQPRFEEVLVAEIAQPKRPGELWIGLKPRLERRAGIASLDLPFHLETGVLADLGAEVVIPGRALSVGAGRATAGLGDAEVMLKYDFLGIAYPNQALALGLEATFPTGDADEGFSEQRYEISPSVLLSSRFGSLETHANFEVGIPVATQSGEDDSTAQIGASLAAHYRLVEGLGVIAEFAVEGELTDERSAFLIAGAWVEPLESVEIGIGAQVPVVAQPGSEAGVVAALWRRF